MPSGAKKRAAEKKRKEQLGKAGAGGGGGGGVNHDNGESKAEVGVVEHPDMSAVGAVDVKDSPATAAAEEAEVGGKREGKSSGSSSDSSSESSSDEERGGVDVPISDVPVTVNGSDAVDDVGKDAGVEIEGKVGSFVDESKGGGEYSTGQVDDVAEEVVIETTPPISESDLAVESVVANTAPASERIVDVVKPIEVEIRETENQGLEREVGGSASLPVERTSWWNCCGLFELFRGSH